MCDCFDTISLRPFLYSPIYRSPPTIYRSSIYRSPPVYYPFFSRSHRPIISTPVTTYPRHTVTHLSGGRVVPGGAYSRNIPSLNPNLGCNRYPGHGNHPGLGQRIIRRG
jgi:hypothetical protein